MLFTEEEIKRLNTELAETSGYTAVGFSYDQPAGGSDAAGATNNGGMYYQKYWGYIFIRLYGRADTTQMTQ